MKTLVSFPLRVRSVGDYRNVRKWGNKKGKEGREESERRR